MRKLLLLLCLALGLNACSAEKHLAESPKGAHHYYQSRQRLHHRERQQRLGQLYRNCVSWQDA